MRLLQPLARNQPQQPQANRDPSLLAALSFVSCLCCACERRNRSNCIPTLSVCGPSGTGKSTLIALLRKEFPDDFGFSVSHTTRGPRPGERDGVDYHFSDRAVMEAAIADGKFLESALVHGNLYGTSFDSIASVADQHRVCILDIDVQVCPCSFLAPQYSDHGTLKFAGRANVPSPGF